MTYETRSVRVHTLTTGTSGFCPIVSFMMIWSPVFLKSFCWQSSIESPKFKIKSQSQRLKRISAGRLLVFVLDALSPLTRFPLSYLPSRGRSSVLKTWINNLNKSSLPVKCNIWHQCSVTTSSKLDCQNNRLYFDVSLTFINTPNGVRPSLRVSQALRRGILSLKSPGLLVDPLVGASWRASANARTSLLKRVSCSTTPSRLPPWLAPPASCAG